MALEKPNPTPVQPFPSLSDFKMDAQSCVTRRAGRGQSEEDRREDPCCAGAGLGDLFREALLLQLVAQRELRWVVLRCYTLQAASSRALSRISQGVIKK